jgi:hypothetical protein
VEHVCDVFYILDEGKPQSVLWLRLNSWCIKVAPFTCTGKSLDLLSWAWIDNSQGRVCS